jgi:hypothetical protein
MEAGDKPCRKSQSSQISFIGPGSGHQMEGPSTSTRDWQGCLESVHGSFHKMGHPTCCGFEWDGCRHVPILGNGMKCT